MKTWTILTHDWWQCYESGVKLLAERDDVVRYVPVSRWEPAPGEEIIFGAARCPMLWGKIAQSEALCYETENLLAPSPFRPLSIAARKIITRPWLNYSRENSQVFGDCWYPVPPRTYRGPAGVATPKHFDVCFVGSVNERRAAVLRDLAVKGLRVAHPRSPIWGSNLADLEARSRVVLNVHYYMPGVFESFRVLPALHRGATVISEESVGGEGQDWCKCVPYETIVDEVLLTLGRSSAAAL